MKKYKKRIADRILNRKLRAKGAVLVEGAKWCGKTTTAEQIAGSVLYMQDPASEKQNLEMAEINPGRLLKGTAPRLIDEWQMAPKLWDAVRFEVDQRDEFGQFILTGSSVPGDLSEISHTGTGRISRMLMRPMSLYESLDSSGDVSLSDLFSGKNDVDGENHIDLNKLAFCICRGGWPKALDQEEEISLMQANESINDLETMGLFFENMCIRDLRVYADSLDGDVYHYRDKNGLECDAVLHLRNGSYGLIEVKLGGDKLINEGVKTLNALAGNIDTDKMQAPSFKMVLVGTGKYAYRQKDGIVIVPIGCLKD